MIGIRYKYPLCFPTPNFTPNNLIHKRLVALSKICHGKVSEIVIEMILDFVTLVPIR
jgi:hypothetical protein